MLVVTKERLYRVGDSPGEPKLILEQAGMVRVAQGTSLDVVAAVDGLITVLREAGQESVATGLDEPIESLLIRSESPLELLIGTEGAHLFELIDSGIRRVESFDRLDCRGGWFTPWGGPPAIRSMAATADGTVYADIHVGSIMKSADWGRTWQPVTPTLNQDVHHVATCIAAPDRVYANTAKAVFVSHDRGRTWRDCGKGLGSRYGRCIAVGPDNPDLILASVSDGPHGDDVHGQLFWSGDCGTSWRQVEGEFPRSTRQNINTYHVAMLRGGRAYAAVGADLYHSADSGQHWRKAWAAPDEVIMLAANWRA